MVYSVLEDKGYLNINTNDLCTQGYISTKTINKFSFHLDALNIKLAINF